MAGFVDMPKKRASSSIERLSVEGRELVEELLADGKTYAEVIETVEATTGEKLSRSALSRFRITDFEPTRRRVEAAKTAATELVGLLRDTTSVEEKFDATAQGLFNIMLKRVMEAKDADVTKLMREARMFQQVRANVRRLDNDEKRLQMEAERLALERRELDRRMKDLDAKEQKLKAATSELMSNKQLPDAVITKMREQYGLV